MHLKISTKIGVVFFVFFIEILIFALVFFKNFYTYEHSITKLIKQKKIEEIKVQWYKAKKQLTLVVLDGVLFNIILILIALFFFRRSISLPLISLKDAAIKIGKGNLEEKLLNIRSKDEIGDLSICFNNMIDELKISKDELLKSKNYFKELSKTLEIKVGERTKDLTKAIEELEIANIKLEELSNNLEKEKTFELYILYEISKALAYTLDYQTLFKLIMNSLIKIINYDIFTSILFDSTSINITLKPVYSYATKLADDAKNNIINTTSKFTGEAIYSKNINVNLISSASDTNPNEDRQFDKLRSFFNVPFIVDGKTVGMINISSCKENAFDENNVRIVFTIVNQASNSIERLRSVITAEKSKMESMVESMTEGIIMFDQLGKVIVFNPQAKCMLGFRAEEEISDMNLKERIEALDLDIIIKECENKKRLITEEIVGFGKQGQILSCEVSPVKDIKRQIIGTEIILRDITTEKEINKMKTEFVSIVSHELRTPLSIIKESISLILDKIPGDINEKQKKILFTANNNIDRLTRIINDLLDISKIEAGKTELKIESFDINELIKKVADSFELKIKEKGLNFRTYFSQEKINVYADIDKITQVFTNLISNSLKFTENGYIEIYVYDKENLVECIATDTGIGISKEDLPKVFSKFKQFGRTHGGGEKGTGLGLSIVKGIIEMHNGNIWVESSLGKGTKFTFTLPKVTPA